MSNSSNRPAFNFFRNLRSDAPRQFAVIGLGRFGRAVCETLHRAGYEVLGTDIDEKIQFVAFCIGQSGIL